MDAWPEGIALSANARAWLFPDARVVLTRSFADTATIDDANALVDFFVWLEKMDDALPRTPPPIVIHDWRSFRRVPREATRVFLARRKEIATIPAKLVVAVDVNPVLRMVLRTVALGAQLVTRTVPMEFVDDPEGALMAAGVTAPDPVLHLRLREAWRQHRAIS